MKLDVFIAGETIDLCIPTKEFATTSNWYSWFNNPVINRYLEQGIFPNTVEDQQHFFESQQSSRTRLMLIISDKENYVGTISLSYINHEKKRATVAIVIGERLKKANSQLVALESMARIVEHGIVKMGLTRIDAGQHVHLREWQQKMELIGFKVEGLEKTGFRKGMEKADAVKLAINFEEYTMLKNNRGKYWDNAEKMMARIKNLPEESYVDKLTAFYETARKDYYDSIFKL